MEQTFANHRRLVPSFHIGVFLALFVNAVWSVLQVIRNFSWGNLVAALLGVALVRLFFHIRSFAVRNQDRTIRLEESLRLERLLPPDLKSRITEFTLDQLVALRFASDAELPELARKVLTEKEGDRTAIKRMIKNWRADLLRV